MYRKFCECVIQDFTRSRRWPAWLFESQLFMGCGDGSGLIFGAMSGRVALRRLGCLGWQFGWRGSMAAGVAGRVGVPRTHPPTETLCGPGWGFHTPRPLGIFGEGEQKEQFAIVGRDVLLTVGQIDSWTVEQLGGARCKTVGCAGCPQKWRPARHFNRSRHARPLRFSLAGCRL